MIEYRKLVSMIYEWTKPDDKPFGERLRNTFDKYCKAIVEGVQYSSVYETEDLMITPFECSLSKAEKKNQEIMQCHLCYIPRLQ